MNRLLLLLPLIAFAAGQSALAADKPQTFYIQVIRGTDADGAIPASSQSIGPKLKQRLSPVFRWKHYWEVSRHTVEVGPKKAVRVRLDADRSLELELIKPNETEIRLYRQGKLVRKSRQQADDKMSIMGSDDKADESWFAVVRREKPQ